LYQIMDSSPMKLRWMEVVNAVLLQKNGRKSEKHPADWKSGFTAGEVKDRVDASSFAEERKRNSLGSSNCAGRKNSKFGASIEDQKRGFTSKRCSGEFNFIFSGKDTGAVNLETSCKSRLEEENNWRESSGKDVTSVRGTGMKVYRPEYPTTPLEKRRLWLERRSLTLLDKRVLMDQSLGTDVEVIRGQMWVQRSSLFGQWKERYLVLRGRVLEVHRLEGGLVSLIRLSQVKRLELTERRGTLTICVSLDQGNFYLRRADGLGDWFKSIGDVIKANKREKELLLSKNLCTISRKEPKITLEELTRLYRKEEEEEIEEEARRKGRRDPVIRSETLEEEDKDSGIDSLQSNTSLPLFLPLECSPEEKVTLHIPMLLP